MLCFGTVVNSSNLAVAAWKHAKTRLGPRMRGCRDLPLRRIVPSKVPHPRCVSTVQQCSNMMELHLCSENDRSQQSFLPPAVTP